MFGEIEVISIESALLFESKVNKEFLDAAQFNITWLVRYYFRQGANIDYQNDKGYAALHYAVMNDNIEMAFYLMSNGAYANMDITGYDQTTPQDLAMEKSNAKLTMFFCEWKVIDDFHGIIDAGKPTERGIDSLLKTIEIWFSAKRHHDPLYKLFIDEYKVAIYRATKRELFSWTDVLEILSIYPDLDEDEEGVVLPPLAEVTETSGLEEVD